MKCNVWMNNCGKMSAIFKQIHTEPEGCCEQKNSCDKMFLYIQNVVIWTPSLTIKLKIRCFQHHFHFMASLNWSWHGTNQCFLIDYKIKFKIYILIYLIVECILLFLLANALQIYKKITISTISIDNM